MAGASGLAHVTGSATADLLARYYDLDLEDDPGDLDLYLALAARTGGPVLELAVGSGRLAVPLAEAGFAVTGVDLDPAMLARAQRTWDDRTADRRAPDRGSPGAGPAGVRRRRRGVASGSLTLVEGDLVDIELPDRFGLAIIALNSVLQVGPADRQRAAIANLARHLRPGGVAVVDVELPDAAELASWDGRLVLDWVREDPEEPGTTVTRMSSARYDAVSASTTLTVVYDATDGTGRTRRVTRTDRLHLMTARSLEDAARDAGLAVELLAGDHQATPLGPLAERAVLMAVSV
jgi:SAM-dependent methyltransferase